MGFLTEAEKAELVSSLVEANRTMVQEELKACLGRTIKIERGPRKHGDPEKDVDIEEVDLVSWLIVYIPRIEAALRGMQADVNQATNKVDALGSAVLDFQAPLIKLAKIEAMIESDFELVKKTPELLQVVK